MHFFAHLKSPNTPFAHQTLCIAVFLMLPKLGKMQADAKTSADMVVKVLHQN